MDPSSSSSSFWALGVDVGGTKIAAGLVSFPEAIVRLRRQIKTTRAGGEAVLTDVFNLVAALCAEAHALQLTPAAVGLGLCELVGRDGQVLSGHSVDWPGLPVRERLAQFAPAWIEADVRAAALAEALFGAGQSSRLFLYVTVGTGISSCLMIEGRPFRGARGATGTMASSPWRVPCPGCNQPLEQTLEEIASGPALVARYNRLSGAHAQSAEEVVAAASVRDPVAARVVQEAAEALASGVGMLVNVLDPAMVVLGGGLGSSAGLYWETFQEAIRRSIWSPVHRDLPVVQARTGPDAGLIGAAAHAWLKVQGGM